MNAATVVDLLERACALHWDGRGIAEFDACLARIDQAVKVHDVDALSDAVISLGVVLTAAGERDRYGGRSTAEPSQTPPQPAFPRQRVNELVDRLRATTTRPAGR